MEVPGIQLSKVKTVLVFLSLSFSYPLVFVPKPGGAPAPPRNPPRPCFWGEGSPGDPVGSHCEGRSELVQCWPMAKWELESDFAIHDIPSSVILVLESSKSVTLLHGNIFVMWRIEISGAFMSSG